MARGKTFGTRVASGPYCAICCRGEEAWLCVLNRYVAPWPALWAVQLSWPCFLPHLPFFFLQQEGSQSHPPQSPWLCNQGRRCSWTLGSCSSRELDPESLLESWELMTFP